MQIFQNFIILFKNFFIVFLLVQLKQKGQLPCAHSQILWQLCSIVFFLYVHMPARKLFRIVLNMVLNQLIVAFCYVVFILSSVLFSQQKLFLYSQVFWNIFSCKEFKGLASSRHKQKAM